MAGKGVLAALAVTALLGCTGPAHDAASPVLDPVVQLQQLLPADALFLGEQHDVPDHQRIERVVVEQMARQQTLAALALEMASQGQSTLALGPQASEEQVRTALQWDNAGWPWAAYGPAVMAAVRAGVPVLGANLPKTRLAPAMKDEGLDARLSSAVLLTQQDRVRAGHCHLLPESQIAPMTRIQIARDVAMAQTVAQAVRPGKTVLLLAGGGHVARDLGVPQHLPRHLTLNTVLLQAGASAQDAQGAQDAQDVEAADRFDQTWPTQAAPVKDYCADFIKQRDAAAAASKSQKAP